MTNKLTTDQVKHVAKLANLNLRENEISKFQKELSDILNYFDKLQEVDTENVEITSQVTGLKNVFHSDDVVEQRMLSQKQALANASHKKDGYIVVPAVIKKQ